MTGVQTCALPILLMHSIHKTSCFWGVSALKCSVFQKIDFSRFSINRTCCSIDWNCNKYFGLTKIFFHASFVFRIHMHCIVFFCIHLAVLQSYLSLFWHITCIHFAKLGTQLDLKIDWLIFESFVHSSICYFYVWTVENYFLKRYNG